MEDAIVFWLIPVLWGGKTDICSRGQTEANNRKVTASARRLDTPALGKRRAGCKFGSAQLVFYFACLKPHSFVAGSETSRDKSCKLK